MAVASDQSSGRPLPRSVRRALDAMRGHVAHTRSVTDLAAEAGVTSRTLQRQFLTFLSKTPRAMVRDIGFENARRELLQGSAASKVMDVALRYGFAHCGRFYIEYRRRYDETPSQTLKRQAYFLASVSSQRCSLMPARSWPTLALAKIEAAPENAELAGHIADDLALALMRAGISVTTQSKSTRYQLIGAIRGSGAESRLIVRLIDIGSGASFGWIDRSVLWRIPPRRISRPELPRRFSPAFDWRRSTTRLENRAPTCAPTMSRCAPCPACSRSKRREMRVRSICWSARSNRIPGTRWRQHSRPGPTFSAWFTISPPSRSVRAHAVWNWPRGRVRFPAMRPCSRFSPMP